MEQKSASANMAAQKKRIKMGMWRLVRIAMLCVIVVTTIIFATNLSDRVAAIEAETEQIQAQIDMQMQIRKEIEDEAAFVQSHAFIERMARRWHGLVHRDEITFIRVD